MADFVPIPKSIYKEYSELDEIFNIIEKDYNIPLDIFKDRTIRNVLVILRNDILKYGLHNPKVVKRDAKKLKRINDYLRRIDKNQRTSRKVYDKYVEKIIKDINNNGYTINLEMFKEIGVIESLKHLSDFLMKENRKSETSLLIKASNASIINKIIRYINNSDPDYNVDTTYFTPVKKR